MPIITIIFGAILDALGAGGFVATGSRHYTSLIPSALGTILIVCGAFSLAKPGARKHFMHAAAATALIGLIGVMPRMIPKLPGLFSGKPGDFSPVAVVLQLATSILLLVFMGLCVKSFIDARRKALPA